MRNACEGGLVIVERPWWHPKEAGWLLLGLILLPIGALAYGPVLLMGEIARRGRVRRGEECAGCRHESHEGACVFEDLKTIPKAKRVGAVTWEPVPCACKGRP